MFFQLKSWILARSKPISIFVVNLLIKRNFDEESSTVLLPPKVVPTFADQVGANYMHIPVTFAFGTIFPPCAKPFPPLHGVESQPSKQITSMEEEKEQEDYDEDEVSTACTYGNHESDSDSRSAYGAKPRKNNSCFSTLKSTGSRDFCDPETRLKMKKLVKVLRGIVQGADEMGTVAV
ncbi:hypothetical protein V6N12_054204 [Hibiscus sabdariffa]|uniref:Uncharacterized protein n=1 Tax=Hibiscus sabdariffa TaxID=183260 RepID=A0ABR2AKJ2_9ROSI